MSDRIKDRNRSTLENDFIPHSKHNITSRFGRVIEQASFVDLFFIVASIFVISSIWFWIAPKGHGLLISQNEGAFSYSIFDCMYFVIVTFTTLGYGDLVPQGLGRLVAVTDTLCGLALTAIIIGKIASQRQSALLLLLHTSDAQRRISEFSRDITLVDIKIQTNASKGDLKTLKQSLESNFLIVKSISNYITFNAYQANIIQFGNFTSLNSLYDEMKDSFDQLQILLQRPIRFSSVSIMNRSLLNMKNIHRVISGISLLHQNGRNRGSLSRNILQKIHVLTPIDPSITEKRARERVILLAKDMGERMEEIEIWVRNDYHCIQIMRVFDIFPVGPKSTWQLGITKQIADQLKISHTVTDKCVKNLLTSKLLPKT